MAFWDWLTGGSKKKDQRKPQRPQQKQQPQQNDPRFNLGGLTNVLSKGFDQVNPLDSGRTWKQRKPVNNKPVIQQITNNAAVKTATDVVKSAVKPAQQIGNLSVAGGKGISGLIDIAQKQKTPAQVNAQLNRYLNSKGTFGAGVPSSFKGGRASKGFIQDPTKIKQTIGLGAQLGSNVVPVGKGISVANAPIKSVAKVSLQSAGLGAVGSAGQQLVETGRINPRQLGVDTVASAALGVAPAGIARGAKAARPAAQKTVQAVKTLDETPATLALRDANSRLQRQFDTNPNPRQRRIISQQIAKNNAYIRSIKQGGYIQVAKPPNKPPKTRVASAPPPESNVPQISGQVPGGKKRGFVKSVQKSPEVSNATQAAVQSTYLPRNTQQLLDNSNKTIKNLPKYSQLVQDRMNVKPGRINDQTVADAIAVAKAHDAKGQSEAASNVYEKLAEHLTAAGQTVQAATLLNRRTPEGIQYEAVRTLKKSGVNITPEIQKQIKALMGEVRKTNPDTPEGGLARYKVSQYVNQQIPTNVANKAVNLWRAGLLTAPTTTGGNILGNTGEALVRKGFVNPVTAAADKAMSLITGQRTAPLSPMGSATKGAVEGVGKLPTFLRTGYDERNALSKYDARELGGLTGKISNPIYRLMSVADQPYWYAARNEALGSIAKAEAINRGLKGQFRKQFINDFMTNPPPKALDQATNEALYATFQNQTLLGKGATGLKKPFGAVGDFIVPFSQVPASIATRIIERTPIGIFKQIGKEIINYKNGNPFNQRDMAQAIGNGTFGPTVFFAGYALANAGDLTFGYPEDPKERKLWESEGKQPYSIKVGDRWYSLNYLQPFGTLLAMGGQAKNAINDGEDPQSVVSQGIATAGQSVMNQSFLKGVSGILDAIDDPKRYAQNYLENTAGTVVPNIIRSGARALDPVQRDPEGIVDAIKSSIPGLRSSVPEKQDMFGRPVPAKDNALNQYLNPLRPSKAREDDPVIKELRSLFENEEGIVPTQATKGSYKGVKLASNEVRELNKAAGPQLRNAYEKVISDPRYKTMSTADKKKALQKVNDTVYGAIRIAYGAKKGYTSLNNLDKQQLAFLNGEQVDFLAEKQKKALKVAKGKKGKVRAKRPGRRKERIAKVKVRLPSLPRVIKSTPPPSPRAEAKKAKLASFKQATSGRSSPKVKISAKL